MCVTSAGGAADLLKTRCFGNSVLAGVVTVCLSAFPACTNAQSTTISGSAEIVDGDTLRLGPVTIRIHGIDAPESDQDCAGRNGGRWRCGNAATKSMTRLADGRQIECSPTDRDAYGRIVAVCDVEGVDLGGSLVASGLAWAFRRYSDDYVDAEADARHRGVGIWQAEGRGPAHRRRVRDARSRAISREMASASITRLGPPPTAARRSTSPRESAGSATRPRRSPPAGGRHARADARLPLATGIRIKYIFSQTLPA